MESWAGDKVERRTVESLIPYARNSRTHSDEQISQIASSIKEWGFTNPVLVDETDSIIAGHGRVLAAKKLKILEVPTMTAVGWSDAQKKAYIIADNKLALNAGWDLDALKIEIDDLKNSDFDIDLTGFDADELDLLFPPEDTEGLTGDDEIPEVPTEPVSKLGDVWVLGRHRVMCGDSTSIDAVDKLTDKSPADMVFTDPPYGIDYGGGRTNKHGVIKNDALEGTDLGALIALAFTAKKTGADLYVCVSPLMQKPFMDVFEQNNADINAVIVWDKKNAGLGYMAYRRQCEFILFHKGSPFHKGDKSDFDLWSFSKDVTKEYVHPTQKPVSVPERAINNSSKAGDTVLDLFGGSGSTLIAAEKTGRNARLMELDEKYVDVIVKRWQNFTGEEALHAESTKKFNEICND